MAGETMAGETMAGETMAGETTDCLDPQDCDGDGSLATVDCNDQDPLVFPGAPELCDGVDNSCNGQIDEVLTSCYTGPANTLGRGICQSGIQRCINEELGSCEQEITPNTELCDPSLDVALDDDCDGLVDEGCDLDNDGISADAGDCDDRNPLVNPAATEVCNGLDDDCNNLTDEVISSCYDGPQGTLNLGLCRAGQRLCIDETLSACQGQITPIQEVCDTNADEDCDGQVDENCDVQACSIIDRNVPIEVSTQCITAGVFSRALVQVQPRLFDGSPLPSGVSLNLNTSPSVTIFSSGVENGIWYWEILSPAAPTTINLSVRVDCGDNEQTSLIQQASIEVAPRLSAAQMSAPFSIGGCDEPSGSVYVEVFDANTNAPLIGASVLLGDEATSTLQRDPAAAIRNEVGSASNMATTNVRGRTSLFDYNGQLSEPMNITIGAEGYENLSVYGVEGGHISVYLRPLQNTQSNQGTPNQYQLGGGVSDFNSLRSDGDTDLAIVLPSLSLDDLTSKPITQLLSRFECWQPATIAPRVLIPGNLYVPNQREGILNVNQHLYRIRDHDRSQDHIVALAGKIQTTQALTILSSGGATASDLLQEVRFKEIGVRLNTELSEQTPMTDLATQTVPLSINLNEGLAQCTVAGVPSGAYASCITAGEWSENGVKTGRVFPMGITNFNASTLQNGASVTRNISHAPLVGDLSSIYYLSTALAIPESNQANLVNASSAIIDQNTLNQTGGSLVFSGFFNLLDDISRNGQQITWSSVGHNESPTVDACEVEVLVQKREVYNPGNCSGNLARQQNSPLWSVYLPGSAQSLSYPSLPDSWPRSQVNGLLSDSQLENNEALTLRVRCAHFNQDTPVGFNTIEWSKLVPTHISVNQIAY